MPLIDRDTCEALIITCSDFRFKSVERAFAERAGVTDDYDLIARPGAARSLVAPRSEGAGATMREEIQLLRRLHRFPRIILLNHVSCRAYDDLTATADEREIHAGHLRQAADALAEMFPGVSVEPYLVDARDGEMVVRPLDEL